MKRSISRPLVGLPLPSSTFLTEGTITCIICQAIYAPSRLHTYLLQAPPIALESAFMSMCHFCFRCRRPSCPNCWDAVHSICGQCARETHVPFRLKTPPLPGITPLSTPPDLSMDNQIPPSLVPVHPGHFQESLLSPTHTASSHTSQTRFPVKSAGTSVASPSIDIDAIETRPDPTRSFDIDAIATHPDRGGSPHTDKIKTYPPRFRSGKQKFIRILIASLLLLLIILLLAIIVASLLLVNVNLAMYQLLHIDIRAELTALWHFLQSLF